MLTQGCCPTDKDVSEQWVHVTLCVSEVSRAFHKRVIVFMGVLIARARDDCLDGLHDTD